MKALVQPVGKSSLVFTVFQHPRAHHRAQGQRHHAGYQHRPRQRQCKLTEQGPGQAADKADRGVDRRQGQGHRHHRQRHFPGPGQGGFHWGGPLLDVAVYVLHYNDGVVHHQPDGNNHGQQGQQVEGKSHRQDQENYADQ